MQAQACADTASVFGEQVLDGIDMFDSIGDVDSQDDMFLHGHLHFLSISLIIPSARNR